MTTQRPTPGTMEAYAAEFDAGLRRADIREVRIADKKRTRRCSRVLPKTTRRPRSASGAWQRLDTVYE